MPSQNISKLTTVLMAPAQTLEDGTLLVLAESSSTFPKIKTKVENWVVKKTNWSVELKNKWGTNFDPSIFQNAKTFTSNRPYHYSGPDVINPRNVKENKNTYSPEYLQAVDHLFKNYPFTNKSSPNSAFKNLPSQNKWNNSQFNLKI